MKKLFVVQKYVMAESVEEALKLEKKIKPTDVFLDVDFKKIHFAEKDFIQEHSKKQP